MLTFFFFTCVSIFVLSQIISYLICILLIFSVMDIFLGVYLCFTHPPPQALLPSWISSNNYKMCSEESIMLKLKEGNVLFNDALNTFLFKAIWHQTYGKKTHSDTE